MSLRARLLAVTVALVAAGLLVAGFATVSSLSSFLTDRLDEQLVSGARVAAGALEHGGSMMAPGGPIAASLPPGTYVAVRDGTGAVIDARVFTYGAPADPPTPAIPEALPGSAASGTTGQTIFTAPAGDGSGDFRVMAVGPTVGGGTLVVAVPLAEVRSTLARLVAIEVLVGLGVLVAVALLARWLVRVGLQPLDTMGATAGAIAAGDLTRRVTPADDRTEVGRLGASLNAMLAQIEAAFDERRASEDRLRRFVADASHELRTPLTSIRGYAELFRRGAGDRPEDLARAMARIEAEAARMGVLVDDLLLLARLDQGRPLEREPVDLAQIAAQAVEAARIADPARVLDLETDATPAIVTGDDGRLRQVLDNLLENARVHTPAGTPAHVRVTGEGPDVLLVVRDEGPGIDPAIAPTVFERFARGDRARSPDTGGAGLGLAIVWAITAAHEGVVRVAPSESGTTIEVRLPAPPRDRGSSSGSYSAPENVSHSPGSPVS